MSGAPDQQPKPAPGADLGGDLGASFRWVWQAFTRNLAAFLVPGIVWFVGGIILASMMVFAGSVGSVAVLSRGASGGSSEAMYMVSLVVTGVLAFLGILVPMCLWQSGMARAAGIVHDGSRPTIGQAFIGSRRVIGTAVLYLLVTFVGLLLLIVPGLIAAVVFMYAVPASMRGASPAEAHRESLALAKSNLGTTIVAYVVISAAASVLGYLVVTAIAAVPLFVLFQFALHERLSGRELTEPVPA